MKNLPRYVNQSDIARELGVVRATVSNWIRRHPHSVPRPDAYVSGSPVWLEGRIEEWKTWSVTGRAVREGAEA